MDRRGALSEEFHGQNPYFIYDELKETQGKPGFSVNAKHNVVSRTLICRPAALTSCCPGSAMRGSSTGRGAWEAYHYCQSYYWCVGSSQPAGGRTSRRAHQVINLRRIDGFIFHQRIFHRVQNIHIVGQRI